MQGDVVFGSVQGERLIQQRADLLIERAGYRRFQLDMNFDVPITGGCTCEFQTRNEHNYFGFYFVAVCRLCVRTINTVIINIVIYYVFS